MVRAFGLHPKGRGFESLTAHQFFFWQYHIFPTITHKDQAFRQSVLSLPVDTFSHSNELRPFIPTITWGYSFYSPWLVKFADMIGRKCLEDCLQKCCCGNDRPSCPVRLIVALRRDCKVSWETKTHAGRNCMAVARKHMENIAEHFRRAMGIGVRQVGFGWSGFHSKMIQLASAGFQTSANLSQTIGLRQLAACAIRLFARIKAYSLFASLPAILNSLMTIQESTYG